MTQPTLLNKTAMVTGASRGLGLEIARQLACAGAHLLLLARDAEALVQTQTTVRAACVNQSQKVHVQTVDLADQTQLDSSVTKYLIDEGAIDIVINNAAVQGPIGLFEETNWVDWQSVFDVDLFAPARICQLVVPTMRSCGWGKIVNLSGGGATSPRPDVSAYAAAKTALVRLSETLAEELRGSGVDVNCVAPGAMNTRMLEELLIAGPDGARREYNKALQQAKTGGMPPECAAELIVFLASPASDGITGRLLSAVWDDWSNLPARREELMKSDIYTLRRIVPEDRGAKW